MFSMGLAQLSVVHQLAQLQSYYLPAAVHAERCVAQRLARSLAKLRSNNAGGQEQLQALKKEELRSFPHESLL
jgi:hypothetical protein